MTFAVFVYNSNCKFANITRLLVQILHLTTVIFWQYVVLNSTLSTFSLHQLRLLACFCSICNVCSFLHRIRHIRKVIYFIIIISTGTMSSSSRLCRLITTIIAVFISPSPHPTPHPPPPFLLIFATKASINSVHYYTDVFCWFQSQLNESLNKCSLASWGPALSWFIALTLERRFNSVISGSDLLALGLLLKVNLCLYCREQGVKGLYKGLEAKLLQTVSTAALMFVTYEKIAAFIFRLLRRTQRW